MPRTGEHRGERPDRSTLRPGVLLCAVMVVSLVMTQSAWGFWRSPGFGAGVALTATLSEPVVSVSGAAWTSTVHVAWTPSVTSGGVAATSYVVRRVDTADGSTTAACGTSAASPTTAQACDDPGVPTGTHRYIVTATLGSWTSVSASSPAFTTDVSAPSITVTSVSPAPNGNGFHVTSPVTVSLSASDLGLSGVQTIGWRIDDGSLSTVPGTTAAVVVSGDGIHTVTYSATDAAGNVSSTGTHVLTIDTTAPSVVVARAAGQTNPSRNTPIVFSVTFSEPVTGFSAADVVLSGGVGGSAVVSGTGAVYSISVSGMTADGTLGASVVAAAVTDAAGNLSTASGTATVVRDTTAPTVTVTSFNALAGTLTLTGAGGLAMTDATSVTVTFCPGRGILGLSAPDFSSCSAVAVTVQVTAGTFTATATGSLTALSWYARLVPQDLAGNVGPAVLSGAATLL